MRFSNVLDFIVRDGIIKIVYTELSYATRDFPLSEVKKFAIVPLFYVVIPYDPVVEFELSLVVK